jgi:hypothetical protein
MFAYLLMLAAAAGPVPASPIPGINHYYGADAFTSAEYLHLRADGRYVRVDAQHMFSEIADEGRWRLAGGSILLESDWRVRDIEVGEFRVYVFDRCGQEALPELRAKLLRIRERGEPISSESLEALSVTRRRPSPAHGPGAFCGASFGHSPDSYPAKPVPAKRLDTALAAIDAWLAEAPTQNIFEYRGWVYRGERFLVAMQPGTDAVRFTASEIRQQMDKDGGRAPYHFYEITEQDFNRRANCTYAFKTYTQLNKPCNK